MSATETKFPPIMKVAAVSVIVFAMAGIGVMTGIIPSAFSKSADEQAALAAKACSNCGVVESIKIVQLKGEGTGVGAVTGGVVGAVVGNQIGSGQGKTLAQVAGAAGGAYAGNEIEKNMKKTAYFRVTVRLNNGGVRSITQKTDPGFKTGDNVRIENNSLVRG
jgi:outer membrane lipoprotein SlyB